MAVFSALCLEDLAWGDGGRCQPAAPVGAQEGAATGCIWLCGCFRQLDLLVSAVGFESPEHTLSCKIARKRDLSTKESHLHARRGACTHGLVLGHTVWLKIATELVLLRDLTSSLRC